MAFDSLARIFAYFTHISSDWSELQLVEHAYHVVGLMLEHSIERAAKNEFIQLFENWWSFKKAIQKR